MIATPEGAVVASQNRIDSVDSEMRPVEEVEIPPKDAKKIIKDQVGRGLLLRGFVFLTPFGGTKLGLSEGISNF
jgi:hypothetical protein